MASTTRIFKDFEELPAPLQNPVLTIGNFDGVHRGHLALFDLVRERAQEIEGQSAVMTFDPHPLKVMRPQKNPLLITPTPQKLNLISRVGIDVIFCISFTRQFAAISAPDFVEDILLRKIGIRELVVGYDYTFGHKREGDIALLRRMGKEHGFVVHVVEPVRVNHRLVSSTSVRERVQAGDLATARTLLGRDYQICGTVIKGRNRGAKLLGFPTANLELVDELTPKRGVYAVRVLADAVTYEGVTNIGYNPTFGNGTLTVETHLLGYRGDLLGKAIQISFIKRLRDEKAFQGVEELAEQIRADIDQAKALLAQAH
jgi:riboflavin kinase/FMN adenylyltransferase